MSRAKAKNAFCSARTKKSRQRFPSLLVCYFRLAKTTAPASVRTALNSIEKSTERLISISPMRHNCPNTMRKQASDGVKRFIASLLCRATAPTTTSGPFFVSEPRMAGDGCRGLGLPTKRPNRDRSELYWRQKGNAVIWGVASPLQSPKRPRMEKDSPWPLFPKNRQKCTSSGKSCFLACHLSTSLTVKSR